MFEGSTHNPFRWLLIGSALVAAYLLGRKVFAGAREESEQRFEAALIEMLVAALPRVPGNDAERLREQLKEMLKTGAIETERAPELIKVALELKKLSPGQVSVAILIEHQDARVQREIRAEKEFPWHEIPSTFRAEFIRTNEPVLRHVLLEREPTQTSRATPAVS